MTFDNARRRFLIGSAIGLTSLLLPIGRNVIANQLINSTGFTHNVASGEPDSESMLFWTRYVPTSETDSVNLIIQVSRDDIFSSITAEMNVTTGAYRDWTAKITIDGLSPGTTYWYRFIAPDGSQSPTGRTKTLPIGDVNQFSIGIFSCANLPIGWFNAYAHAAERDDLDLWIHLGDYIYEYGIQSYQHSDLVPERETMPAHEHEMIVLADYRLRYACYRSDPDLQKLHQMAPMVSLWDDHEIANDSWEDGAQNHQPEHEGDWGPRRLAAMQAYREWLPVSEAPWAAYTIGELATLYRTESRLLARTQPLNAQLAAAHQASNPQTALSAFRDSIWQNPDLTMLGSEQEQWLASEFLKHKPGHWQVVGMATIMGRTLMPAETLGMLHSNASERTQANFKRDVAGSNNGVPMWMDRWDGYPAARSRFLNAAQQADADLVMLSGDSHNAWAYSLTEDGRPAGVEFACQGVTSNGIENSLGASPNLVARAFIERNPELVWANTHQRGYLMLNLTPEAASGEWQFLDTIKSRSTRLAGKHQLSVKPGQRQFEPG